LLKKLHGLDDSQLYELAGKIAYDLSVWHEIATWYGASYLPLIPERYSSFSPEDLYSNLLGVILGIQALKSDLEYDEAMTILLAQTLDSMEVVTSIEDTYSAMEKVENIWWTRERALPSSKVLLVRYMDSGSSLLPWLVPNENYHLLYQLDKPDPGLQDLYELSIKANWKFPFMEHDSEQADKTITQNDFSWIISRIEDDQRKEDLKIARRPKKRKDDSTSFAR
jgi:hypothetical protein